MPRATLIIDCDISALRRTMGEIPGITARAQGVMTGAARRGGRERVGVDRTFEREHESIHMQLARARERQAREATAKEKAEGRKQVQADAAFARERDSIHARLAAAKEKREKEATRAAATEGRKRVSNDAQFAREHDSIHRRMMAAQMQRERQATREQRLEGAGFVVDNSGDTAALAPQIEQLWRWLQSLPQLPADYQFAGRKDGVDKDGVDKDGVDKDGAAPTA
ncbi:MAG: hypothetical protein BWZ09_02790 [Alphaproteobacteria bacterium ADurb.BinA305]|nr:MAG: hypothetical protein BWZ09_02790 [Alphaproteobacteria bacterium ADurb.BinA305]